MEDLMADVKEENPGDVIHSGDVLKIQFTDVGTFDCLCDVEWSFVVFTTKVTVCVTMGLPEEAPVTAGVDSEESKKEDEGMSCVCSTTSNCRNSEDEVFLKNQLLLKMPGFVIKEMQWKERAEEEKMQTGLLGSIRRVTVNGVLGKQFKKLDLIWKGLPPEGIHRDLVVQGKMALKEACFYNRVGPALQAIVDELTSRNGVSSYRLLFPRCFSMCPDSEVLILEDMLPAGYHMPDVKKGLSIKEINCALFQQAAISAASLAYQVHKKVDLEDAFPLADPNATDVRSMVVGFINEGFENLNRVLAGIPDERHEYNDGVSWVRKAIAEALSFQPRLGSVRTLCHGDLWANNLLFRERSGMLECMLIDWQFMESGLPTSDLPFLFLASATLNAQQVKEVLDTWWGYLTHNLNLLQVSLSDIHYDRAQCDWDFHQSLRSGVVMWIASMDILSQTEPQRRRILHYLKLLPLIDAII
ncbi:unnamed protein product [Cyprideis torosa]|uniref:Uncharacterized protein n=1 Tax=Cyprideis torosa TaxID=163714 RepID=A0A7R8ZMW6_9CRUS|nr:unnamed protein product [Cyprideis torosa]CAG0886531.1 unnamed protein product [Cyprideis torosa]